MEHTVTTHNAVNRQQGMQLYECHCCGQVVDRQGKDMTGQLVVYWCDGKLHTWTVEKSHGPRRLVRAIGG